MEELRRWLVTQVRLKEFEEKEREKVEERLEELMRVVYTEYSEILIFFCLVTIHMRPVLGKLYLIRCLLYLQLPDFYNIFFLLRYFTSDFFFFPPLIFSIRMLSFM